MKKSVKILALVLAILMICIPLTACGKELSGKYEAMGIISAGTYEFDGSDFTYKLATTECKGTYEIKDDKIIFDYEESYMGAILGTEFDFEETEEGIKIGSVEYKKAD